ncbi:hypothetical protein N9L68_01270 [bacterium]|nr:hypothetical protein [bacterium]
MGQQCLPVAQELLGDKTALTSSGQLVDRADGSNASGCVVNAIRRPEPGSRRVKPLVAWDYDAGLVAFITPIFDVGNMWRQATETIEPMGSGCSVTNAISHTVSVHHCHWRMAIGRSGTKARVWQPQGPLEHDGLMLHQNRGSVASW